MGAPGRRAKSGRECRPGQATRNDGPGRMRPLVQRIIRGEMCVGSGAVFWLFRGAGRVL